MFPRLLRSSFPDTPFSQKRRNLELHASETSRNDWRRCKKGARSQVRAPIRFDSVAEAEFRPSAVGKTSIRSP